MTVLLRLAYDGTDFHGFARQAQTAAGPAVRTVQGELESALASLYREPVRTRAASRTDAGVHALGQIVGFAPPLPIPAQGVVRGLTSKLPGDIGVLAAWTCELPGGGAVDPRFYNAGKVYRYRTRCTQHRVPTTSRHEWHLGRALDTAAMQAAARHFVGEHDFAGFRASGCQAATTVRRVTAVEVEARAPEEPAGLAADEGRVVSVEVRGEAFLQNMVRIMVGTLVEVGLGARPPGQVRELLERPDRTRSGRTAPPQGLTLVEVRWPETWPPADWERRARPPGGPTGPDDAGA